MATYTPMIQQYLNIKAEYDDCFVFFRLGDFYELFFDDAEEASRLLEITLTSRDGGKNRRIPMCGVPYHSAESYIARLIEKGHKVAICEQVEDPSQAKGVVRREVVQVITPGTVMASDMLEEKRNNFLVAICQGPAAFGLAAADVSTGEFWYTSLNHFTAVLDETAAYAPAELLLDVRCRDREGRMLEERFNASITTFDHASLSDKQARSILEAQFKQVDQAFWKNELAVRTTAHLLHYLMETQKRALDHMHKIAMYEANQYMQLDMHARRNLELTETIRDKKRHGSLLWLLDHTSTAMGGRLLKRWLDRPLLNRKAIEERLTAVSILVSDMLLTKDLHDLLKSVYDLERLAGKVACGSANGRDLIALKNSLETLPRIQEKLERADSRLIKLCGLPDLCTDIAEMIGEALVDDPPVSVTEGGLIRNGFDQELDRLLQAKREGTAWVTRLEQEEREKTGIKSLKVAYNRVFGYYIEVTKANLHLLPEGRYERKQTLANAERFITPELKEKEALILEAEERSVKLEYELFVQLRSRLSAHVPRIQTVANWVAMLDVWQSFATISARYGYTRPEISDDLTLTITGGRHPVVERVLVDTDFTPNDTDMDPQTKQIVLITGPNMAGKSTYMRQVALIVLMAHIGCFVPAEKAKIPLVDRLFTRIGAADDLVGGQSTFMVEMLETKQAITEATERSLILLDEIGRGTSTYDGMAIAHAIVWYIHEVVGAKTLFSTHYHELTALADELNRVTNVHARCEEREGQLLFLHRIEQGRADRSYGVHVAQLSGMPQAVIDKARSVLSQLENQRETVTSQTEEQLSFVLSEPPPPAHKDVLDELVRWDVYNRSPLESAQFLEKLQKKIGERG